MEEELTGWAWDEEETILPDVPAETKEKVETVEEESEEDFFNFSEEREEEPKGASTKESVTTAKSNIWKDYALDLKEKGILRNVSLDEQEDFDEDTIFQLQEEDYEIEVENRLASFAEDMDEEGKAFIKFKLEGGKTRDFLKTLESAKYPTGDLEDESYQDEVIRYQLEQEGWDEEEIEERLSALDAAGTKKNTAKKYEARIQALKDKEVASVNKSIEDKKKLTRERQQAFKESLESTLSEDVNFNGLKISKNDKTLLKFMTAATYKVEGGGTITGWQKKMGETLKDPKKALVLGKLLMSDFDFSEIEKLGQAKQTEKLKSRIGMGVSGNKSGSSKKSLIDLF